MKRCVEYELSALISEHLHKRHVHKKLKPNTTHNNYTYMNNVQQPSKITTDIPNIIYDGTHFTMSNSTNIFGFFNHIKELLLVHSNHTESLAHVAQCINFLRSNVALTYHVMGSTMSDSGCSVIPYKKYFNSLGNCVQSLDMVMSQTNKHVILENVKITVTREKNINFIDPLDPSASACYDLWYRLYKKLLTVLILIPPLPEDLFNNLEILCAIFAVVYNSSRHTIFTILMDSLAKTLNTSTKHNDILPELFLHLRDINNNSTDIQMYYTEKQHVDREKRAYQTKLNRCYKDSFEKYYKNNMIIIDPVTHQFDVTTRKTSVDSISKSSVVFNQAVLLPIYPSPRYLTMLNKLESLLFYQHLHSEYQKMPEHEKTVSKLPLWNELCNRKQYSDTLSNDLHAIFQPFISTFDAHLKHQNHRQLIGSKMYARMCRDYLFSTATALESLVCFARLYNTKITPKYYVYETWITYEVRLITAFVLSENSILRYSSGLEKSWCIADDNVTCSKSNVIFEPHIQFSKYEDKNHLVHRNNKILLSSYGKPRESVHSFPIIINKDININVSMVYCSDPILWKSFFNYMVHHTNEYNRFEVFLDFIGPLLEHQILTSKIDLFKFLTDEFSTSHCNVLHVFSNEFIFTNIDYIDKMIHCIFHFFKQIDRLIDIFSIVYNIEPSLFQINNFFAIERLLGIIQSDTLNREYILVLPAKHQQYSYCTMYKLKLTYTTSGSLKTIERVCLQSNEHVNMTIENTNHFLSKVIKCYTCINK